MNVLTKYGMKLIQNGGAKAMAVPGNGRNFLVLFLVAFLALLLKAWLVYLTYNAVAPKLMENSGGDSSNFRPLTFMESVLLVILVQNLVN